MEAVADLELVDTLDMRRTSVVRVELAVMVEWV